MLTLASSSFFFNDAATAEIYTLSLHDALPISGAPELPAAARTRAAGGRRTPSRGRTRSPCDADPADRTADRKSTRLNSSHVEISYAVFCLKKKTKTREPRRRPQDADGIARPGF